MPSDVPAPVGQRKQARFSAGALLVRFAVYSMPPILVVVFVSPHWLGVALSVVGGLYGLLWTVMATIDNILIGRGVPMKPRSISPLVLGFFSFVCLSASAVIANLPASRATPPASHSSELAVPGNSAGGP